MKTIGTFKNVPSFLINLILTIYWDKLIYINLNKLYIFNTYYSRYIFIIIYKAKR